MTENINDEEYSQSKHAGIALHSSGKMKLVEYLPEYSLLDFLLNSPHTVDLQVYADNYDSVPYADTYRGKSIIFKISAGRNS